MTFVCVSSVYVYALFAVCYSFEWPLQGSEHPVARGILAFLKEIPSLVVWFWASQGQTLKKLSGFSGEKGQSQAWCFLPLSLLPFPLSCILLVPTSQLVLCCSVRLRHRKLEKNSSNTKGEKHKRNVNEAC